MLNDKIKDDPEQRVRVMRRVKLMLDPAGSKIGRDIPLEELANMSEEQKQAYEAEQVMRGFGNKCLRKMLETLVMSAIMTLIMHQTGLLDVAMK